MGKKESLEKLIGAFKCDNTAFKRSDGNLIERLCAIYLDNPDIKKRERALRKFAAKYKEIGELVAGNWDLLADEIERAFMKLAAGYFVTETVEKTTPRGKFRETRERYIPPNAKAAEFLLVRKRPDAYGDKKDDNSAAAEMMEALKNVR